MVANSSAWEQGLPTRSMILDERGKSFLHVGVDDDVRCPLTWRSLQSRTLNSRSPGKPDLENIAYMIVCRIGCIVSDCGSGWWLVSRGCNFCRADAGVDNVEAVVWRARPCGGSERVSAQDPMYVLFIPNTITGRQVEVGFRKSSHHHPKLPSKAKSSEGSPRRRLPRLGTSPGL